MLKPETPFPYVGSYALHVDQDDPGAAVELVRIMARRGGTAVDPAHAMIAYPLRDGAGGNRVVPEAQLIDATPLTAAERREFNDLDLALRDRTARTARQKRMLARRDALRQRIVYGPIMDRLMRFARQCGQQRKAA